MKKEDNEAASRRSNRPSGRGGNYVTPSADTISVAADSSFAVSMGTAVNEEYVIDDTEFIW